MKILICSAEEGAREAFKLVLQNQHELIITDSLDKFLEIMKSNNIATAIVDIDKQENIADKIKSLNDVDRLNIIAFGNAKSEETLKTIPCKKYLLKPIKSDELLKACE